jgi:hypothetical protein
MGVLQFNPKTMPLRKNSSPLKLGGGGGRANGGGVFCIGKHCCWVILVGAAMIAFTIYADQEMVRNLNENQSQLIRKPVEYLSNLAMEAGVGETTQTEVKDENYEIASEKEIENVKVVNKDEVEQNLEVSLYQSSSLAEGIDAEPKHAEDIPAVVGESTANEVIDSQQETKKETAVNDAPVMETENGSQSSESAVFDDIPAEESYQQHTEVVNPAEEQSLGDVVSDVQENVDADAAENSPSKSQLYLHVGPQKTGSSSLQTALDIISQLTYRIEDDNLTYEHITPETGSFDCELGPWGGFVNCVVSEKLKKLILQTHISGQNLLLTDENLGERFVGPLRDAIKSNEWDVTVIVMYRRIHEWLVSWWNQINKTTNLDAEGKILIDANGNPYREEHKLWPSAGGVYVPEFTAWYKDYVKYWDTSDLVGHHRSVEYFNLYKETFDHVKVYNMHSDGDIVTNFFCEVINMPNTCKKLQNNEVEMSEVNASVNLHHDILATYFYDQGFVHEGLSRPQVVAAIGDYVKRSRKEIPRKCDAEITGQIFGWLVESEKIMLKETWNDSSEEELRGIFDAFVAKGKICDLDRETVLQDEEWRSFFKSLGAENTHEVENPVEVNEEGVASS